LIVERAVLRTAPVVTYLHRTAELSAQFEKIYVYKHMEKTDLGTQFAPQ